MKWSEIEGDRWNIPGERTKNGLPHIVPLSATALEIIGGIPRIDGSDYLFASGKAKTRSETGERMVNRPVSGFGRIKERLDKAIAEAIAKEAGENLDMERHALTHWTLHDIRRSVVTGMNESLEIEPHVIEAVVNHSSGRAKAGVAGIYNRAQYLLQRKLALEAWANHVLALAGKPTADNVVTFPQSA